MVTVHLDDFPFRFRRENRIIPQYTLEGAKRPNKHGRHRVKNRQTQKNRPKGNQTPFAGNPAPEWGVTMRRLGGLGVVSAVLVLMKKSATSRSTVWVDRAWQRSKCRLPIPEPGRGCRPDHEFD